MTLNTGLLLLSAVLIALLVSYFQYFFKAKSNSKLNYFLAFLRFLGILLILVLLINPTVNTSSYELEKTPLALVVDNSKSMLEHSSLKNINEYLEIAKQNSGLNKKFDLNVFNFGSELVSNDSLTLKEKATRLDKVAKGIQSLYGAKPMPVAIITDGNATSGENYTYSFNENFAVYPIVVGDTTLVYDLNVDKVNANKFTFLKNKFPIEVFINATAAKTNDAVISLLKNNIVIAQKKISFSKSNSGVSSTFLVDANQLGVHKYTLSVKGNLPEKNIKNNSRDVVVEVIDQRTKIGIISTMNHPDISALKRSIESNEQRQVSVLNPNETDKINQMDLFVLYQPNTQFLPVFNKAKQQKIPTFIITGTKTDFVFLNENQDIFSFSVTSAKENFVPNFNSNFTSFIQDDIGFYNLPPLEHPFGKIKANQTTETLLTARINNIVTTDPLLAFAEVKNHKHAFLFGENLWKWRLELFKKTNSFETFDLFIGKVIQYTSATAKKKNLLVEYETRYNASSEIELRAQYFNANYEFDANAKIKFILENKETKKSISAYFVPNTTYFSLQLDDLIAGNYTFKAIEEESKAMFKGAFEVDNFDAELQFTTPNYSQLNQLANQNNGAVFLENEIDVLLKQLTESENFKPIQKEIITQKPLIDWLNLLILALILFATEWFIRKYNGLL